MKTETRIGVTMSRPKKNKELIAKVAEEISKIRASAYDPKTGTGVFNIVFIPPDLQGETKKRKGE